MRITLVPLVLPLVVLSVPVLCDKEEPPTLHPEPPTETWSRFAPLDDVRLLANNLLQLGQSMREFAQKTKGQMNSIFQKLNIFDRSFYRLSALAGELKEDEEELKKTTVILRADNEVVKDLSGSISSKMESLLQEKSRLQNKVDGLEEKVSRLTLGLPVAEISSLRDVIQSQEQSISELLKAVAEQSEQLDQQKMKIKTLEKKLTASVRAQETSDKTPESSNSEAPTLPPFLTSGSSSFTSISGWWFNPCGDFNPNGRYFNTRRSQRRRRIQWRSGQKVFSLRFTQISITFPTSASSESRASR